MLNIATKNFKKFWIGGMLIFICLVLLNPLLITNESPLGIVDHQTAGDAIIVNSIHHSWNDMSVLLWAKILMISDLLFIGIYAFGSFCGGILLRSDKRKVVKRLGSLIIAASILFGITDYIETIAQVIQLLNMQGDDDLASIAAAVNPFKTAAFLVTCIGLSTIIIWDKIHSKS